MIIALDYDGTYTADPGLWDKFILDAEEAGHGVVCVTNRAGPGQVNNGTAGPIAGRVGPAGGIPIVYCNNQPKRRVMLEQGFAVHVWIDDMPHLVDFGNISIRG